MEQLSLIEKLSMLVKIVFSSPFFLVLLIIIVALLLLLLKFNKKIKKDKSIYLKIYLICFILLFAKYGSSILKLCDNLVENIFSDIYFPSLSTYLIMLFINNIILIITIISKKISKGIKILNTICFVSIEFLAVLILDTIIKENVNIYEKLEVYTNQKLLVLIELSMGLFALWMFALFVIKCINLLIKKYDKENQEQIKIRKNSDPIEILNYDIKTANFNTMVNINDPKQDKYKNDEEIINREFGNLKPSEKSLIDFNKLNNQFEYNVKNNIDEDLEILDFDLAEHKKEENLNDILGPDDYKYIKAVLKYAKDNDELQKIKEKIDD